jgi:hypothetical protein
MDNQRLLAESLVMDLKRVALGLHQGSFSMANRFKEEALKRCSELEEQDIDSYLKQLLLRTQDTLRTNTERVAEDTLMYSTLLQNFVLKRM